MKMLMVENVLLGRSALCGSGVYWEAELTVIDGEINSICTRSYKGFGSKKPYHYLVHYPLQPLMCMTRFKGLVSHGHHINPETGIQHSYSFNRRAE
jgi:hypothetical protein